MTDDKKYILKTMIQKELDAFKSYALKYYNRLTGEEETLIIPVLGIYSTGTFILMIMKNLMPHVKEGSHMYDFKGSTKHRTVNNDFNQLNFLPRKRKKIVIISLHCI